MLRVLEVPGVLKLRVPVVPPTLAEIVTRASARPRRSRFAAKAGLLVLLAATGCAPGPTRVGFPGSVGRVPSATVRVQMREGTAIVVRDVPLERYAAGAALSEVHPAPGDDALAARVYEVQAVIARSYAVANRGRHAKDGFDLCSHLTFPPSWVSTAAPAH